MSLSATIRFQPCDLMITSSSLLMEVRLHAFDPPHLNCPFLYCWFRRYSHYKTCREINKFAYFDPHARSMMLDSMLCFIKIAQGTYAPRSISQKREKTTFGECFSICCIANSSSFPTQLLFSLAKDTPLTESMIRKWTWTNKSDSKAEMDLISIYRKKVVYFLITYFYFGSKSHEMFSDGDKILQ